MNRLVPGREVVLAFLTLPGAPGSTEMVDIGAAAGFDGVTIRAVPVGGSVPSRAEIKAAVRVDETLARVNETGVTVADVEYVKLTPSTVVAELEPLLEAAGALGARHVNVMGADPDEGRMVERFAELCDAAAVYGLRPTLEFAAYTAVATLGAACRLVTRAARPNGALAVDTHHLWRSGGSLDDLRRAVMAAPERFPVVHVSDAPRRAPIGVDALAQESRTDRRLPGDGELEPADVVAALPSSATVHVEAPVMAHARLDAEVVARRAARAVVVMFENGNAGA